MYRLLVSAVKQRIQVRAIFSEPIRLRGSRSMAAFTYPQARRDETVLEDYHGTKVSAPQDITLHLVFGVPETKSCTIDLK